MLVLSRKRTQRLFLGADIVVEVTEIRPGKVRLGITAPRELPIYREEVAPDGHPLRRVAETS